MATPAEPDRRRKSLEERVFELEHKAHIIERLLPSMANKAEVDQLTKELSGVRDTLATVATDVTTVATSVTTVSSTLQTEINNLASANPELDLTALKGVSDDLVTAAPALDTAAKALQPTVAALADIQPVQASPEGGGGQPTVAPVNTLYDFSATNFEEQDARFTASGFETAPTDGAPPVPLFYFSGDTVVGEQNGATVPGYTVYGGPVQPAPPVTA